MAQVRHLFPVGFLRSSLAPVVYDRERPSGIGPLLAKYVSGFDRVFVDISGMSRMLIVQIIVALVESRELYAALNYSQNSAHDLRRALNEA